MIVAAFPLGFFVRNRTAAFVAYIALHSFVFTFQSTALTLEWASGDYAAFDGKDPNPWPYGLVNVIIYGAGLGLVALGQKVSARRRRAGAQAVDLAA